MRCGRRSPPTRSITRRTSPRCRSGLGTPTSRPPASTIIAALGSRTARPSRSSADAGRWRGKYLQPERFIVSVLVAAGGGGLREEISWNHSKSRSQHGTRKSSHSPACNARQAFRGSGKLVEVSTDGHKIRSPIYFPQKVLGAAILSRPRLLT
jgi:hypothetical protein